MSLLKNISEGFEKLDRMIEDAKRLMAKVVIEETNDGYTIKVNLPSSVKKEDIDAYIEERTLKVHTPTETALLPFPQFSPRMCNVRNVLIPSGADENTATAKFETSVLTVSFEKKASAKWHKIIVE